MSISVVESAAVNDDSASYSYAMESRWVTRWLAVGLLAVPLSGAAINKTPMLSLAVEGEHPGTLPGVQVDETIGDDMLLHEMERIARHLSQARPQFSEAMLSALYGNPESLYI